jgi:hypothetical protein
VYNRPVLRIRRKRRLWRPGPGVNAQEPARSSRGIQGGLLIQVFLKILVQGWQIFLLKQGRTLIHCYGDRACLFCGKVPAQGIGAEIPEARHRGQPPAGRGIGAYSPVSGLKAGNAPKFSLSRARTRPAEPSGSRGPQKSFGSWLSSVCPQSRCANCVCDFADRPCIFSA